MLENEVVAEIVELMSAMDLFYVALDIQGSKQYFLKNNISDIPFEKKYQLLDGMRETYEILNNEPWYFECDIDSE